MDMEQSPSSSRQRVLEPEFNLKEWGLKARISRENTNSRRFSASYIRREDTKSFRSNFTISSTASSPGYTLRGEIDPSTYSFTTALKALQARSAYINWECLSPDGFALNSKWNEAEKYICNPLSGEVPMECLSAKTLSGRSFPNSSRIPMSAPLVYSSQSRLVHPKPSIAVREDEVHFPIDQEKKAWSTTKDVGTQSTPPDLSSSSPSPAPTPSIEERSIKRGEAEVGDSPISNIEKLKSEKEVQVEVKETREKEETKGKEKDKRKKAKQMCRCRQVGCLSWRSLWMRKSQREKQKTRNKNTFLHHINGC
ncbi:hypothetical protein F0562_005260 [Nyssa sinensis]|uniref:Uncharacterized protein n=1 Tax=Nyssa sinensis TaxID=561372 RepID=A0A5J5AN99_9ASTE|nr:hypothetical protein F0562_005260 [Nyssa sinensis]